MSILQSFYGSGGRKRANARVFLIPLKSGTGKFTVNKRDVKEYFSEPTAFNIIFQPLQVLGLQDLLNQYHIQVTVKGGGKTGQCDAIRLGLAKALVMLDVKRNTVSDADSPISENAYQVSSWRKQLRKEGLLTRDSRKVERKRYGLHKARKRAPLVKR